MTSRHVQEAIASVDISDLADDDDPIKALPHRVGDVLDVRAGEVTQVRYYHATRAVDPSSFRRNGLLPLGQRLDRIWVELGDIASDDLSAKQFRELREAIESGKGGDFGRLYRMKTNDALHHGPFGEYVREYFLRSSALGTRDYLSMPEILEDIALVAAQLYDIDLLDAYSAATRPYIVSFDMAVAPAPTPPGRLYKQPAGTCARRRPER